MGLSAFGILSLAWSWPAPVWPGGQSLRFEGDADAFLPQNDPVMSYNDVVEDRFGIRDLVIVGVLNKNPNENGVFNPRTLATIKEFSEKIALLPGIKAIRDEDVASVATLDNITGTVDGMAVDPFMETVPQSFQAIEALKQALFHNSMFVNWIVSQDGTGMLIMAKMEPGEGTAEGTAKRMAIYTTIRDMVTAKKAAGAPEDFDEIVDYDYQHANVSVFLRSDSTLEIERVVETIQDFAIREFGLPDQAATIDSGDQDPFAVQFGRWLAGITPTLISWETNSGFRIGIAGNGYLTNRFNELVVAGQLSSLVVSLGAVFLLSAFMFRSWVAGLINIIPISLVMIFSFGLLGLLDIPLEIGKSLTASMVIGIGVDYTIHFLNKYRVKVQEGLQDAEQITAATMATSGKAIFFNALVVAAGFLVFLISNFRPNFYLGAMLSLNMVACLFVSMTVLPTILNRFKPRFVYGEEKMSVIHDAA